VPLTRLIPFGDTFRSDRAALSLRVTVWMAWALPAPVGRDGAEVDGVVPGRATESVTAARAPICGATGIQVDADITVVALVGPLATRFSGSITMPMPKLAVWGNGLEAGNWTVRYRLLGRQRNQRAVEERRYSAEGGSRRS